MYLGIDIGASYCKAAVIDQNYNLLHTVRKRMPNPIDPKNVKLVEYNVDEILYLVYDVIKSMSIKVEKKIDGIGISGQMHGMLLLDDSNKPITNFISWQDKRTTEKLSLGQDTYLEFLRNSLKKYRSLTGIDLKPGMMGPILFWFKKNGYFNSNSKYKAAFISDYIVSVLTEKEPLCDPTNASGSGIYDINNKEWLNEYLEITEINNNVLPNVVETGSFIGGLAFAPSSNLNIKQGVPVYVSIGDYQAALISSKLDDKCISINIGTGAQVSLLINDYIISDNYEIRPYINNSFTKCVSGLPGGRLLGLFDSFINNILNEFSNPIDGIDILSKLDVICSKTITNTDIICNPNFFNNNFSSNSGFTKLTKSNFNIFELYFSSIKACVQEYYNSFNMIKSSNIDYNDYKILLSGGVANKSQLMRNIILDVFNKDIMLSEYKEEAAVGAAMIAIAGQLE